MLAVVLAATGLVVASAQGATAQPADQSAAERCSEIYRFGAEPVDVAKTADGQTVLSQVSWGYHDSIGCYLALDNDAVAALRAAGPPASLPQGQTEDSRRCFEHYRFGAEPVDVAKTADGQTVLARLSWGYHDSIGCYLALDSAATNTLRAAAAPPEAPEPPGSVSAASGDGQLTVSWTSPADNGGAPIVDYTMAYQAGATTCPTDIDNTWNPRITSTTSATIEGLANGTAYRVCVKATNQAGDSDWTGTTATPATVPGAPGNISVIAGDGQLTVSWTSPADNGGAPITGYTVAYKANAFTCPTPNTIGTWTVRNTSNTSTTIRGLANTHSYRLCVRASNSAGLSNWNETSSSPSDRPGQPTGVRFTGTGPDRLTVAWTAPASTGASAIAGYTVQWCTAASTNDVCASSWSTASATGTGYAIAGLAGSTSYGVRVQAVNSRGTGPWSSTRFASTTAATPPGAPSGLAASVGDRQIDLRWNAPSANGAPITGYAVECRLGGTAVATGNCGSSSYTRYATVSGTSTTITGLANGTAYDIRVRAANRAGSGAWATIAATPATRPRIPTNVEATASGRNIQVTWTAPASGGAPITRYTVQSCSGGCTSWRSTTVSGNPPATTATISGLATATTYRVRVRAVNSAGESGWSATDTATTPTRPETPTDLTVTVSGPDKLTATWTAPVSVSGVSHYNVQRCTARANSDGTWRCTSGWSNAGTATDTSHVVTGLNGSTDYSVRVQAENAAGTSGWSNTYTAPTDPPTSPGVIDDLTATAGNRQVRLSWTAPAANGAPITRYEVTCEDIDQVVTTGSCSEDVPTLYRPTSSTSITVRRLTNGIKYRFAVTAFNSASFSGGTRSFPAADSTPATRPGPPTDITINPTYPGNGGLTLGVSWTAPTEEANGGSPITGYTVQYRASGGNWSFVYFGDVRDTSNSHEITGLTVGPRYYVQIRSHNAAGESSWVSASSDPTGTPGAPDAAIDENSVSHSGMTFRWESPDPGASEITDYHVQWCTARARTTTTGGVDTTTYSCTGSWRSAPEADINTVNNRYEMTGLTGNTSYSARVRAVNIHGNGPWSDVDDTSFATTLPPLAPTQPDMPTAIVGNSQIRLSWTAPDANGAPITRYTILCQSGIDGDHRCDNGNANTYTTSGTSGTSYTITGLTNGVSYDFWVSAYNSAGYSPDSPRKAATPAGPPDPPDPDDIVFTETYTDGVVTLDVSWTEPENDGGHPDRITGYTVQYRASGGNWSFHYFGSDLTTPITGLTIGHRYDVQIRSHTNAGESSWAYASATPTGKPAAPTISNLLAGVSNLRIDWPEPDQGASDITSYRIQQCIVSHNTNNTPDDSDDTYTCSGWTSLKTIAADDGPSYTSSNLACGTRYGVRVQAVNSYGSGPWSATDSDDDGWSAQTDACT